MAGEVTRILVHHCPQTRQETYVPCTQCGRESHQVAESPLDVSCVVPPSSHLAVDEGSQGNSHLQNLRQAQLDDPGVAFVLQAKENASKPSLDLTKSQSLETHKLLQQWDQLEVQDGLLAHKFEQEGKGVIVLHKWPEERDITPATWRSHECTSRGGQNSCVYVCWFNVCGHIPQISN